MRELEVGSIDFGDVLDVSQPVARFWSVGCGCDCALTLMADGPAGAPAHA